MNLLDKLKRTHWFRTRPLVVQKAHDIWSPGDKFLIDDEMVYLIGFSETEDSDNSGNPHDLMLILSKIDPTLDYEGAINNVFRICARHFKSVTVQ